MYKHQNKGIAAGIAAGCFWGTPFIAPVILSNFSPFEITFGRFFFFGLISLFSLPRVIKLVVKFNKQQIIQILLLSASGFWLYTLILFIGVQLTNGVIASLIIGCMPLTITLFSKPKTNTHLYFGLSFIIIGMFCLLLLPIIASHNNSLANVKISGIIILFIALMMWTWFGIANSKFMLTNENIKSTDYSSLIGIINIIVMLPAFIVFHGFSDLIHHTELFKFIIWALIIGIGASWIANVFWAYSAKNCPSSVGGALIVSETIFGVIYSFILEHRFPHINEFIAIICLISGVILVISSQRITKKIKQSN